jgi:phosphate transport system permease protein
MGDRDAIRPIGPPPDSARRAHHGALGILVATGLALGVVLLVPEVSGENSPFVVGVAAYAALVLGLLVARRLRARTAPGPVAPPAGTTEPVDAGVLDLAQFEREEALVTWPESAGVAPALPPLVPPLPDHATDFDVPIVHREDPATAVLDFPGDRPIKQRKVTRDDVLDAVLAAAAAAAIAVLQHVVTDANGLLGFAIVWYLGFLAVFYILVRDRFDGEAATDRLVTTVVWSVGTVVLAVLTWMLLFLLSKGLAALRPGFFTEDLSQVGPLTPGGGAFHAIVGTVEQVGIAIIVVVPLAVLTAVYLNEIQGGLAKPVRFIVDAMSGLPSIVAGLLIFTVYVDGRGFSGFAGSMALIVLMLPTVTRASEEILRTIPDALRESSLALGAPQWRVIMRVVVPTARAGLVTATILGIARAVGETAPMLLTAFGSDTTNWNPFVGPQADLPLFVLKLYRVPNEVQNQRAYTGLLVLVMLVLVLFLTARAIANRGARRSGGAR